MATGKDEDGVDAPKPMTAFVGTLYVGTDRLGRPLTGAENRDLKRVLNANDFVGASLVSLRFAFRLRRSKPAAHDLNGRASLRLVRQGWDPHVVTLIKCLCRFVWSEHLHERRANAAARDAEEGLLREQSLHGTTSPSAEELAVRREAELRETEEATSRLESLRAAFTEASDEINLLWLDCMLADVTSPGEMAARTGHDVGEFYLAQERRRRLTKRLLAAESGTRSEEDA
jgi:hypothetical protein